MNAIVLCKTSAIRAMRHERRVYGSLCWDVLGKAEQQRVLNAASANRGSIDFDELAAYEIWNHSEHDELHVLVGSQAARRHGATGFHCHVHTKSLLAGSLLRIAPGLYCVSPALALRQCAYGKDIPYVYALAEELMGTYSMPPEATIPISWGGVWPDAKSPLHAELINQMEQAYYGCEPVLTLRELRALARKSKSSGCLSFCNVAHYALERCASPGEMVMSGMLGLPMRLGGFAVASLPGGMLLNHRIEFGEMATKMASGIPYAICDVYIPAARTDIEYNGFGHERTIARIHDGNRNNGLRGEGIRVIVINRDQMRDISALEAIAQSLYKEAGVRFRYRVTGYRVRQAHLLNGLRAAIGLSPV